MLLLRKAVVVDRNNSQIFVHRIRFYSQPFATPFATTETAITTTTTKRCLL